MTLKDLKDQKRSGANKTKTKKTKNQKKQTESNSKPKSRRNSEKDKNKPKKLEDLARYSDPRSRPGLYYGNDGLKIRKNKDGTKELVEKWVHPTKT